MTTSPERNPLDTSVTLMFDQHSQLVAVEQIDTQDYSSWFDFQVSESAWNISAIMGSDLADGNVITTQEYFEGWFPDFMENSIEHGYRIYSNDITAATDYLRRLGVKHTGVAYRSGLDNIARIQLAALRKFVSWMQDLGKELETNV